MLSFTEINENDKSESTFKKVFIQPLVNLLHYWNYTHYRITGKRLWDLGAAIPILLTVWPLFLLISILIKLDSEGPVIYKQDRIGKDGNIFGLYKFRTMKHNSDHMGYQTSENDPRITRIGKLIRPISLDELPQLLNIIKGDMSFIGPRPLSNEEYTNIKSLKGFPEDLISNLIPKVRPGILGWAIFYGREKISYEDRCRLNMEYEEKQSLLFDSFISWLTMKKYWFSYAVVITIFTLIPIALILMI